MGTNYNDWFVSGVAFAIALAAAVVSGSSWESPYQFRTVRPIVERFGKTAGRFFWVCVAVISMIAGVMIAGGIRPGYAKPKADGVEVTQ